MTFTAPSNEIRHVSFYESDEEGQGLHHASLKLLQVDSVSRAKFAASYYGSGRFVLADWDRRESFHHGNAWLMSLSREDRDLLKRFEYVVDMHADDPIGQSALLRRRRRRQMFNKLVSDVKPRPAFRSNDKGWRIQVVFYDEEDS